MNMIVPKVTVIMNTVNEQQDYLKIAIESYLLQQGCEIELIISTVENDPCIEYVKTCFPKCKIVTMPRAEHPISTGKKSPVGSFLQLNNALKHMTGDWFTFASGNDFAYPFKCITEVMACLRLNKQVCYSAYDYVDESGKLISHQYFHAYDFDKHLKGNFVADCSMISKKMVDKYLPFNVELKNYAYWDLWLRMRKVEGNVFVYNPRPTWGYRQDRNSMHVQRWKSPEDMKQAELDKQTMLKRHL